MDNLLWNGLSMRERAAYIRDAVSRGIFDIDNIRLEYNEFKKGGNTLNPPLKYIYDELPRLLREAGLDVKVSSGYRRAGAVGTAGNRSWHPRHGAVDIVPLGNTTFEDIEYALHNNPVIRLYMLSNNFGLLDESGRTPESRATMHRTGATGPHFHIGRDSKPAALYRQRVGALLPTEDGKVVYFTNPFIPIPEPEQTIEPIITESLIIDNPIPSLVPELRTTPEELVAYEQKIPEVVVHPERKLYIRPDQMLALMNEMVTPYTPIKYSTLRSPSVADRLAQINSNRVTLLLKDLEDTIIRNNLLGIQNPDKLRRDAEDIRFYRNMSALGGNLFEDGGDTNPAMIGMMKSKLATAAHFGNPTARRMTNYDTRSYTFPNEYSYINGIGELLRGNVFVSSYDNLVTPQIQDNGRSLEFVDNVWSPENDQRSYMQSLKFNNEKDARYFGEHYKEIAPMMNLYENGGNLFDGTSQSTLQMNIAHFWNSQKPFYEELAEFNRQRELERQAQKEAIRTRKYLAQTQAIADKRAKDYLTTSNDAIYNTTVSKNSHLHDRAIEGAKAHAAWEKEHPNLTAWGNILGAAPFAVASIPAVATVGSGIAALGDAAAATSVGLGITNFLTPLATTSVAGATVPQWFDLGLTSGFGAHGVQTAIDEGGVSPMTAFLVAPLGRLAKPIYNVSKSTANFVPTTESNMAGIRYAYNRNPELANIGTLEDYNEYLKTVFPESKVRDINYHMGPKGLQELKPSTGEIYNTNPNARGIYVTPDKSYSQSLRKYTTYRLEKPSMWTYIKRNLTPGGWDKANEAFTDIYPVMIDTRNPLYTKGDWTWGIKNNKYQSLMKDYDAVVNSGPRWYQNFHSMPESIVPKTEQTLLLGSDADVIGFRKFMSSHNITVENAASMTPEVSHFYHGSPVRFDTFSADFIGSGEGGSKVMRGINLWPVEKIANAPKFANIKSPDAPLHLGVSSTPLGGKLNPTVYDVSGRGLKLYTTSPREVKGLSQSDLISQGYDGIQTPNQVTVFPESIGKLSIDKQSSIEDFVMSHPEVEKWTPWTTDKQKMQNIIDMSKMSKWTPVQWTAAQDAAIARGDMTEAQRLRDLHFKVSAPDTKVNTKVYHGNRTDDHIIAFDKSRIGSEHKDVGLGGFWFIDDPEIAKWEYALKPESWGKGIENAQFGEVIPAYINLKNPVQMEQLGLRMVESPYGNYPSADESLVALFNRAKSEGTGKDGFIFRLKDSDGNAEPIYESIQNQFVVRNPTRIKSADAVTYDDKGVRIPLGKRDNFNINDIRYNWIPWVIGSSTLYGVSNQ